MIHNSGCTTRPRMAAKMTMTMAMRMSVSAACLYPLVVS